MTLRFLRATALAAGLASAAMGQDPASAQPGPSQTALGSAHRQNFSFSNMDIRSAFRALSASGRVDIVVAPSVSASSVNLILTDKTWQEAMLILCQMYGLKYLVEDNYLYVMNLADFNKSSVENAQALQAAGSMAPLMRDIIKLKNAKAKDLMDPIGKMLSTRGKVDVVERNNALLVFDTRANIREIRAAIRELDVETYQVNIQAQMIQVDADALREVGVDWQFGVGGGKLGPLLNTPGKLPTTVSDFSMVGTSNQSAQSSSSSSSSSGSSGGSSPTTGALVGGVAGATTQLAFGLLNGNLALAVANLVSNLHGEVLAKPQITTIDNTEAKIFMGEQVPIRVLDATGHQAIQLQDAGTSLTVTPHVTADGRVLLDLNPEKNSFRVDPSAGTILQKQSAKTTVVVNDGETVVIAGLTTKEETSTETGVPLLKDIPLLGYLFKHTANSTRKRDLIVFVTPHIVAQANRGDEMAKNDLRDLKEGEGVYGDNAPSSTSAPAPKSEVKKSSMDAPPPGKPDYP
ncbi:MAG: type IV pilus secretin PilQ [Fibrobacteres bacterium]|nr:type IV pilus secretin PilQ [Fibrobacterota bacterium]